MKKEVVVERVVAEGGGESTASSVIWAFAFVIIIAMLVGFVYYTGIWKKIQGGGTQKVDVTVSAPS